MGLSVIFCYSEHPLQNLVGQGEQKFLKKLKTVNLCSSNPTSGRISRKDKKKPSDSKRRVHPNVHCSTIYNSQDLEVA